MSSIEATSGQSDGLSSSDPLSPAPPVSSRKRRLRQVVVVASVLMLFVTLVSPAGAAHGKWRPSIQNRNTVKAEPNSGGISNDCRMRMKVKWRASDQTAWEVQVSTREGDGNAPYSNPDDWRDSGIIDAWSGWYAPDTDDDGFSVQPDGIGPTADQHKFLYRHTFDECFGSRGRCEVAGPDKEFEQRSVESMVCAIHVDAGLQGRNRQAHIRRPVADQ